VNHVVVNALTLWLFIRRAQDMANVQLNKGVISVVVTQPLCGPGSSVGIAIDYGLDGTGIESRWGEIFRPSRPTLGPTQPPVQWIPDLSRG
jgi:hypothetical protein